MPAPMGVLALLCAFIGLGPLVVAPVLDRAAAAWASEMAGAFSRSAALAPLGPVTVVACLLAAVTVTLGAWLLARTRTAPAGVGTWDCGYAAPTARMQYTSSSFAEMLVGMFGWALRPSVHVDGPRGLFPAKGDFTSHVPDTVLDRVLVPRRSGCYTRVPLAALGSARERPRLPPLHPRHLGVAPRSGTEAGDARQAQRHSHARDLHPRSCPPLLLGVITKTKAAFAGRVGPPLLQPYYDLVKLFQKGSVFSRTTTWVFRAGPVVGLVTALLAALLVPLGGRSALVAFDGDFIAPRLPARPGAVLHRGGRARHGLGVRGDGRRARGDLRLPRRAGASSSGLLVLARASGSLSLSAMLGPGIAGRLDARRAPRSCWSPSRSFIVLLAENCRIPVDDPNTHLELTMIHEVMVLDHSGPAFGLILYGAAVKLFVFARRHRPPRCSRSASGPAWAGLGDSSARCSWPSRS